ncbi:hypothetical protein BHE74_00016831 [Ensete ventricosum]|uniref:Uncharacterized protein n=1 Tax=Ensete ventricosum TaxID=4639 RepID=A0A444DN54_ENSVE|nr:hypothetical protein GW17_00037531 [Ensete ventricosum]RWW75177.1 hypothetical protein BHE74_00016831 [Ensete ventricosum]RZR72805.1 hypothetical protein BHM03_00017261 [Ensete ventricosum]
MMMWKDSGVPADSFYEARSECAEGPKSKFKIKGVHPSIRGEVWEFLLGCFDPKSTFDEREQQRQHRR